MENLYGDIYEEDNFSMSFEEVLSNMKRIDKKLRKLGKKKKGGKKTLKKRIKVLELEHDQLKKFIIGIAYQNKMQLDLVPYQQPWWQEAICNSLPKFLDLATASISRLPSKTQKPFYLEEENKRK